MGWKEKLQLKLRLKKPLHEALEKSAGERGVSLNNEMVERLEQSYSLEHMGGRTLANIVEVMARVMNVAGKAAAMHVGGKAAKGDAWLNNPYCYDQALKAARTMLENFRPPGSIVLPVYDEPMPAVAPNLQALTQTAEERFKEAQRRMNEQLGAMGEEIARRAAEIARRRSVPTMPPPNAKPAKRPSAK